jgi:hypothetical protein
MRLAPANSAFISRQGISFFKLFLDICCRSGYACIFYNHFKTIFIMKLPAFLKACTAIAIFCSSISANAQIGFGTLRAQKRMIQGYVNGRAEGKKMKSYLGYEMGVYTSFANRMLYMNYPLIAADGTYTGEGTFTHKLKGSYLGAFVSIYHRLAMLNDKSCLAFDWGFDALAIVDETGKMSYNTPAYNYSIESLVAYWHYGVPLLIDYKYGGEATYDKADNFSFTLGAGIMPMLAVGAINEVGQISGSIAPLVKAEIGFFAGVQWKVRAMYMMQSGDVLNTNDNSDNVLKYHNYRLNVKPGINIGISVMPFSFGWDNSRW